MAALQKERTAVQE